MTATHDLPRDPPRGGPGILALCMLIPALIAMIVLAIAPGLLDLARVFGTSQAQLIQTLPMLLMIVGAGCAGLIAERLGRRTTLILFMIAYALGGGVGYVVDTLAPMLVGRAILGFSAGVLMTTAYGLVGEYYEGQARERILGFMSMTGSLAAVLMLALGGQLVEAFGWRAPFLLYLASAILIPLAIGVGGRTAVKRREQGPSWGPVFAIWPIYVLLTAYTIGVFMMAIQGAFLLESHGVTASSTIGTLLAVSSLFGALGGFCYGFMRRWLDFGGMFVWISATMGGGLVLAVWAPNNAWFVLASFVTGLGMGVVEATIASEIIKRVPEPSHDRALGLNVVAMFLGPFLNPWVVAPLVALGGIGFAVLLIGGAYLVAGGGFLLVGIRRSQRRAAAPELR